MGSVPGLPDPIRLWGPRPCLGFVRADTEFDAKYAAYDKGLLPVNNTFGPEGSSAETQALSSSA